MLFFIPIFSIFSSFSFLSENMGELKTISSGLPAFESFTFKKKYVDK